MAFSIVEFFALTPTNILFSFLLVGCEDCQARSEPPRLSRDLFVRRGLGKATSKVSKSTVMWCAFMWYLNVEDGNEEMEDLVADPAALIFLGAPRFPCLPRKQTFWRALRHPRHCFQRK